MYHPDTAISYHTHGLILSEMRDPLAFEYLQTALAIREYVLGADHANSMETLELLKELLRKVEELNGPDANEDMASRVATSVGEPLPPLPQVCF
jgi:hypothetical protein